MKITEVSYRRTFNLGNYESVSVELKASVDETDATAAVVQDLRDVAKGMHAKGLLK